MLDRLWFRASKNEYVEYTSPVDKQQLKTWMELIFTIKLAEKSVCPGHVAPLDAAWACYQDIEPTIMLIASRGFGGKTTLLAAVGLLKAMDGASVNILGGSGEQSRRVHEIETEVWVNPVEVEGEDGPETYRNPIRTIMPDEPSGWKAKTIWNTSITALTASSKSARGSHKPVMIMDEVDEMDIKIYDAATGVTMDAPGITRGITRAGSTHQYPDGTVTALRDRFRKSGVPVMEWCYRESHVDNGGWLTQDQIDRKRKDVPAAMWEVEYELQEPSAEGRVFDTTMVKTMFQTKLGKIEDTLGRRYAFERPREEGIYVTGADWAKEKDYTVIVTIRVDVTPARLVAFERIRRESWPKMINRFKQRVRVWGGKAGHDAQGVGNVVSDYLEDDVAAVTANVSLPKKDLYTPYALAVEHGEIASPYITTLQAEHRLCKHEDLYLPSGHPPDGVCAMAIAWLVYKGHKTSNKKQSRPVTRIGKVARF